MIDFCGFRILTDPVFSERAGLDPGFATAGPKRFVAPAPVAAQLPRIDLVLLSPAQLDPMDLPPLKTLCEGTAAVTAKDAAEVLAGTPVCHAMELGWGEKTTVRGKAGEMRVGAFAVRHWGRRWPSEKERGYNGYILHREGRSLIFGGDTAFTDRFAGLRSKGPFELALMPLGACQPWIHSHCTPEQAVAMADSAGGAAHRRHSPSDFQVERRADRGTHRAPGSRAET